MRCTKEDIFYYIYGLLHSPEYRERYKNDLKKMLPRIPFVASANDFWTFKEIGLDLAYLHLNYEDPDFLDIWPKDLPRLEVDIKGDPYDPQTYKIMKMRFKKRAGQEDKTTIVYNELIEIRGIPLEAYRYVVNGKSPIEWVMERYQVMVDRDSGIVNDPNKWLEEQGDPDYIIDLIERLVLMSIETQKDIANLPPLKIETG